jgi:hypothetical protein
MQTYRSNITGNLIYLSTFKHRRRSKLIALLKNILWWIEDYIIAPFYFLLEIAFWVLVAAATYVLIFQPWRIILGRF